MLEQLLPILIVGLIVLGFLRLLTSLPRKDGRGGKIAFQHYYLVESVHSKAELAFDKVLHSKLGPDFRICPKVRLSDFAKVRTKGVERNIAYGLRRRCDPRHADWIITRPNGEPVCWIELDDKSHNTTKAKIADKFKNDLADAIGIPLIRFRVGENYRSALDRLPI